MKNFSVLFLFAIVMWCLLYSETFVCRLLICCYFSYLLYNLDFDLFERLNLSKFVAHIANANQRLIRFLAKIILNYLFNFQIFVQFKFIPLYKKKNYLKRKKQNNELDNRSRLGNYCNN